MNHDDIKNTEPIVGSSDKTQTLKFVLDDSNTDTESEKQNTTGVSIRIVKIECIDGKTSGNYTIKVKTDTDGNSFNKTYTVGVGAPAEPGDKVCTNLFDSTKVTLTCTGLDGQVGTANFQLTYHTC